LMYRGVIPLANTPACIVKLSNTRGRVSGNNLERRKSGSFAGAGADQV
jgi:hypothetical protein